MMDAAWEQAATDIRILTKYCALSFRGRLGQAPVRRPSGARSRFFWRKQRFPCRSMVAACTPTGPETCKLDSPATGNLPLEDARRPASRLKNAWAWPLRAPQNRLGGKAIWSSRHGHGTPNMVGFPHRCGLRRLLALLRRISPPHPFDGVRKELCPGVADAVS